MASNSNFFGLADHGQESKSAALPLKMLQEAKIKPVAMAWKLVPKKILGQRLLPSLTFAIFLQSFHYVRVQGAGKNIIGQEKELSARLGLLLREPKPSLALVFVLK